MARPKRLCIATVALSACLAASLIPAAAAAPRDDRSKPGPSPRHAPSEAPRPSHDGVHVLVKFEPGTPGQRREDIHRANHTTTENTLEPIDVEVVRVSSSDTVEDVVARYRKNPNVVFAEPNYRRAISAVPDDPYVPGNGGPTNDLWGFWNTGQNEGRRDHDMDLPEGWDLAGIPQAGTVGAWPRIPAQGSVGLIDTGVDSTHADLQGALIEPCFSATLTVGVLRPGCDDSHGHGTHVTGTVAATANNAIGVAGVAPTARVYMCSAYNTALGFTAADISACINEITSKRTAYDIRVISMSFAGPGRSDTEAASLDLALQAGILPLAAAGNNSSSTVNYPAGHASVVSVGATDRNGYRAPFSNYNADVELSAPGEAIISTVPDDAYGEKGGTSMATPAVAGVALLTSWRSGTTGEQLRALLRSGVDDLGPPGRDGEFGFGRVNLCRALGGCAPPANDAFEQAQVLQGDDLSVEGTTIGATEEPGEPNIAGLPGGRSIWYSWTAPATGLAIVSTHGTDFDTLLGGYKGSVVNGLVETASSDDHAYPELWSRIAIPVQAGSVHRFAVDGYGWDLGEVRLSLLLRRPTFADVASTDWAFGDIEAVYDAGIVSGCSLDPSTGARSYCPDGLVTRRQMAKFIVSAMGLGELFPATPTFADVASSDWAYGWIERAVEQRVVNGCFLDAATDERRYCPDHQVTRRQMAVMLMKARGLTELKPETATFADIPTSDWAFGWIERAHHEGVVKGCMSASAGAAPRFCPDDPVTRRQMAVFVARNWALSL